MTMLPPGRDSSGPIIFDPAMQRIYALIEQVAVSSLPVLLLGETGTGKEVAARFLHESSGRAAQPLIRISCAGLTETVVESELFGHERGSFSGALATHVGVFEASHGGTLFLDEIGELPLRTQAKLLRVLELGELSRVGSTVVRKVDVRFVAATHRDLPQLVASGQFRGDLYYRLNGLSVVLPALRERPSEIIPLARHFLRQAASGLGRPEPQLDLGAQTLLAQHAWPGNIRELRNVMERAVAISSSAVLSADLLALDSTHLRSAPPAAAGVAPMRRDIRVQLRDFERACIVRALDHTRGNQTEAARLLGLSRRTLTNRLNALGVERPRKQVERVGHETEG